MKQSEIKEASTAELQEQLAESTKAYTDLKMAHAISPLEKSNSIKSAAQKHCKNCDRTN